VNLGIDFSPAVKISYDFTKQISGGLEYYAGLRKHHEYRQPAQPAATILPCIDLNVSPKWRSTSA